MLTIDGLVSGIDTATIVEGLLEIQQKQIGLLQTKKQDVLAKQSAFRSVEALLLGFQGTFSKLTRSQNNVFTSRAVTVSDESSLAAAVTSGATPGSYALRINSLAQTHQVATQGFADPDAVITQGTFTVQVGSAAPATITIDGTNATLQGLADTLNAGDLGVTATIINDGTGGATPYRLLLASADTGTKHTISLTNDLAATAGDATRPEFDLGNPVQEAADATISLGSGPGAITVQSSSNLVDNVIPGVTLDLLAADPAKPITLTVRQDTETAVTAIQEFVEAFNTLMEHIDGQVRYDAETSEAGLLLGNRDVINLQDSIRQSLLGVVPGLNTKANRLTAIGVTVTDNGRLTLNTAKLTDVLNGKVDGVNSNDVRRLFGLTGTSNNPQIEFLLGSTRTKASETPYQVDLIQAAERALISATNPLAVSTIIDGSNNTLNIDVDGIAVTVTLADGTYTAEELAAHLEEVVNANQDLAGRSITATQAAGVLSLSSRSYGSSSVVAVTGGTALATLGFVGAATDTGQDVAGSFIVNGQVEAATGRGRLLTGSVDNATTADLQIRVSLTTSQITAGVEGEVSVTRGVASRLDQLFKSLLDPVTGRLKQVDQAFDQRAEDIQTSIDRQQLRFDAQQQSLISEFVALESALQQLQTTSSFLSSQLTGLRANNN